MTSDGTEVLAAPYAVYGAPLGTAFPLIDDAEEDFDEAWVLFGTNGTKNYVDSGVVVTLNETTADFTGAGGTIAMNAWRTQEGGTVGFTLADLSIEQFAAVMDMATITSVAATTAHVGQKSFSLTRGVQTYKYAILVRGLSPEGAPEESLWAQYEITRAYQSTNQTPTYTKGTPAELGVEFTILDALNENDGVSAMYRAGTAPAT